MGVIVWLIGELRAYPVKFYNYCRTAVTTFDYVLLLISENIQNQNTNSQASTDPIVLSLDENFGIFARQGKNASKLVQHV